MSAPFKFEPVTLPDTHDPLRQRVREFLKDHQPDWSPWDVGHSWTAFDRAFSLEVGKQGWIGMTWPARYGGAEATMMERYVVIEEMLAVGAPVCSHWIADRQSGPLILRIGTEEQRQRFLPAIARGEISFCIGLSEPNAGSDLAAIRTSAVQTPEGWRLNGQKVWTTNAHLSEFMIALVRTEGTVADRQKGLSQVIVDLSLPGVEVREIEDLTGDAHFNEVVFNDVLLPHDALIGTPGSGWAQATAELAFERSGPDRFLSSFPLLSAVIDELGPTDDRQARQAVGTAVAEAAVLRQMSLSIAQMLEREENPINEASIVKTLGVDFEQGMPELARRLLPDLEIGRGGEPLGEMTASVLQLSPTFSLRGGTREIIKGIIARGMGMR